MDRNKPMSETQVVRAISQILARALPSEWLMDVERGITDRAAT